ncbi:allantoinase [Bacillus sp. 1NLA3E]|nr:allantoinase [Bacillus sp. 1NLA3E]
MNEYDLVIKNGSIVSESGIVKADLAILQGKIVEVSTGIPETKGKQQYDAMDLHILPGLIDTHVHLNEPGRAEWEGISSGSRSLAAGGVTTYFDMPLNSSPPTINRENYMKKKQLANQLSLVNFQIWGGLVPENLDQMEELKDCGVIGFKAFMSGSGIDDFHSSDELTLYKGMEKISNLNMILAVHAESDHINLPLTQKIIEEGRYTGKDYSESRPVASEIEAVQKVITLAKMTGCKLHIVHASSSRVVGKIQQAKLDGVDISVETCPHYLSLTVDHLDELGAIAKCAPPLRDKQEVELLWKSLQRGEIDMIGSDHSPSPIEMKGGNIFEAWGGISGAQSMLNILLEEGYWKRQIPLETIVRLTSSAPAKRFNLYPTKGSLNVGSDADITIIDLKQAFILKKDDLFYKHPHSPYIGKKFRGKIIATLVNGRCVFHCEQNHPL